ncbi:hypothetical protein FE783_36910 [Paenibacillus mesophilus]|uniref:hypothetical protein n=1 Tax=Paenibacillus mesophilus TaxID=2582849 RepID=UPI00110E2BA4|nr:hypothetical protein [Paenibacillus mesophilus]TMV42796.1 hypothetical protein FE783_36910 [Paenibacillus mesophilus]
MTQQQNNYRSVKLTSSVKVQLEDLKAKLKLKSESEVTAYLVALYTDSYPKMTVVQHENYLERAKEMNSQGTLL